MGNLSRAYIHGVALETLIYFQQIRLIILETPDIFPTNTINNIVYPANMLCTGNTCRQQFVVEVQMKNKFIRPRLHRVYIILFDFSRLFAF